jgi:ABC-type transport system substrate-binding protein
VDNPSRLDDRARRRWLGAMLGGSVGGLLPSLDSAAATAAPELAGSRKVLRLLFQSAETNLDPARISDLYSRSVTSHIFEALYGYDHLARPPKLVPRAADGMPEVADNFRTWTIKVKKGIWFPDDPAFQGRKRELLARDFVYAFQRVEDPANISPIEADVADLGIVGLADVRKAALASRKFDYDRPIEGLVALDSHTLRIRVDQPRPRLLSALAQPDVLGGVAREVVEFYGDAIGEHPVGTGPFRLKSWRRSSRIVLERNPAYREATYDAQPAADDVEGQAMLARFAGRRLPIVDEVDISIIDEFQPQWLAFLNREVDGLAGKPGQMPSLFAPVAIPNNKLAPHLARAGVQMHRTLDPDIALTVFNMEDPMIGGMEPHQVALRRAISLAYNVDEEIRNIRRGQAMAAQSIVMPHTTGYDPAFKCEMSDYDLPRARALLDLYGFADRDGDGWRERPDGSPLLVVMNSEPEQIYRAYNELLKKCFDSINVRLDFKTQQWPENLKAAESGKYMMWMLGSSGKYDGQEALASYYGPQTGNQNLSRFRYEPFDRLYDRMSALPDGPERDKLFFEAKRIATAFMPAKIHVHRYFTDLLHPWVYGFRRPLFWNEWWHRVDVDVAARNAALGS